MDDIYVCLQSILNLIAAEEIDYIASGKEVYFSRTI